MTHTSDYLHHKQKSFITFGILFFIPTDNEGDKINIVCDDDFKFFMGEDSCLKLIFNFDSSTKIRKRSISSSEGDIITEYTKKVRKQLQSIEITSDESSDMEIESGDETLEFIRKTRNAEYSKNLKQSAQGEEIKSPTAPPNDPEPIPSTSGTSTNTINEAMTPSTFSYGSLECSSVEIIGESIMNTGNTNSVEINENTNDKNKENVEILDIQIIKPANENDVIEIPVQVENSVIVSSDENGNRVNADVIIIDDQPGTETCEIEKSSEDLMQRKKPLTRTTSNRISISDSDDENDNEVTNNRNESNQNTSDNNNNRSHFASASAYSFTNLNGDRFESASRTEASGGRRRHCHRSRSYRSNSRRYEEPSFREQMRSFHRSNAENFERIQENIRATGESVQRTFSATASMFPDLATTFRSHFVRPLFGNGVHQHFFDASGYHH